jgi:hypothetical protein
VKLFAYARGLVKWPCSWLVLLGIWLAFVGIFAYTEAAVGAATAALAASALVRDLPAGDRERSLRPLHPSSAEPYGNVVRRRNRSGVDQLSGG